MDRTYQKILNVSKDFYFFPSETQHVIQIADAASYCILRILHKYTKFLSYWKIIINKTHKDLNGKSLRCWI